MKPQNQSEKCGNKNLHERISLERSTLCQQASLVTQQPLLWSSL